jgi:hypothetical protein
LHLKRQLEGFDAGFELLIALHGLHVALVQAAHEVELGALLVERGKLAAQIAQHLVHGRVRFELGLRALIQAGQKGGLAQLRCATERDKARQILVFRAESIQQPRAKRSS